MEESKLRFQNLRKSPWMFVINFHKTVFCGHSTFLTFEFLQKVCYLWVSTENLVKMYITGENGFQIHRSCENSWENKKSVRTKGNFLCKIGQILKVVAAPQKKT